MEKRRYVYWGGTNGYMDRVIVKADFDNLEFLHHIEPYIKFYNNFLHFSRNDRLYLELTDNAVVLVYKDLEAFRALVKPPPKTKKEFFTPNKKLKDSFILRAFFPKHKFPAEGLHLRFELIAGPFDELIAFAKMYIQWIDPDMPFEVIADEGKGVFAVHIATYRMLIGYSKTLIYKYLLDSV